MILGKNSITKLLDSGKLEINPFNPDQIGPASIDLTLGNEFRILGRGKVRVVEEIKFPSRSVKQEKYILKPGETVLGITRERISLPSNICAWLQTRSRFARAGLQVHASAAFIQPGANNKTVMEITNLGPFDLELVAGTRICQLILAEVDGKSTYKGKYKNQLKP